MSKVPFPVLRQVVLDTTGARRLAEFYRQLLGFVYRPGDGPPAPGEVDEKGGDWLVLQHPSGTPRIAFQQVAQLPVPTWPDQKVPQQLQRLRGVTTVPPFRLACLAYLTVALPGSTLGLLWPSMRLSLHEPVAALGILLAFGVTAGVVSSAATGRIMARLSVGTILALLPGGIGLVIGAFNAKALAPSLLVLGLAMCAVYGLLSCLGRATS